MRVINFDAISNVYEGWSKIEDAIKAASQESNSPEFIQELKDYVESTKKDFWSSEIITRHLIDLPIYIQLVLMGAFNDT